MNIELDHDKLVFLTDLLALHSEGLSQWDFDEHKSIEREYDLTHEIMNDIQKQIGGRLQC
jgi:hypothetical protein